MITIVVKDGDESKEYKIFRKLLMWHSAYFTAALDREGGFAEAGAEVLQLEYSHQMFDAFYCWLYTGRLKDRPSDMTDPNDVYLHNLVLSEIWLFADCRGIPQLGNSAIDMLHERYVATWRVPTIVKYVYDNTTEASKLHAYLIESTIWTKDLDSLGKWLNWEQQTVEYLHDVMPKIARRDPKDRLNRKSATPMDRCKWHDHSGPGGRLRLEHRQSSGGLPGKGLVGEDAEESKE